MNSLLFGGDGVNDGWLSLWAPSIDRVFDLGRPRMCIGVVVLSIVATIVFLCLAV